MKNIWVIICLSLICGTAHAETATSTPSMALLDPLIGDWQGTTRHFRPRDAEIDERTETLEGTCRPILDGYYVECITELTRPDGRTRALHSYTNYNAANENFEFLLIFRGWSGKIIYPLDWNDEEKMFVGFHDDETRDGTPVKVRVEFGFSEDGREHWAREFNHIEGEPEDYWPQTFEMLRQKQ